MKEFDKVRKEEGKAIIIYDTAIYSSDILNAVAQYMIGKCQCFISNNDESGRELKVEIIDAYDLDACIAEFQEEVISYKFYMEEMEQRYAIRKILLEASLKKIADRGDLYVNQ